MSKFMSSENTLIKAPTLLLRSLLSITLIMGIFLLGGCKDDNLVGNNPVPIVSINRSIDMNNPLYSRLNTQGSAVYLDDEGHKGVIVVRDYFDNFYAYDRTCPYHINQDCGKVMLDKSGFEIGCGSYTGNTFTPCCDSKFNLDGSIKAGPTEFPLRTYRVSVSGSVISIFN